MREKFCSDSLADFGAKYSRTFGWLHLPEGKRFIELSEVDDDYVYFKTGGDQTFHVRLNTSVDFEFIPVDRGWYNAVDHKVFFLQRVPQRQWKRGISQNNTAIFSDLLEPQYVDYKRLNSIFSLDQPWPRGMGKVKMPYALSKHFAIDRYGNVNFYNQRVGKFDANTATISVTDRVVEQEIRDTIRRQNYDIKVV